MTSCMTRFDSTKQVNLLLILQVSKAVEFKAGGGGGQSYSDTSPHKVSGVLFNCLWLHLPLRMFIIVFVDENTYLDNFLQSIETSSFTSVRS